MTDTSSKPPLDTQLIVALAIVGSLGLIAVGLIVGGIVSNSLPTTLTGVGTIIGALSTALNAPTGVSNALKAMREAQQPNDSAPK